MTKPPRSATVTVYRLTQGSRFAYTATARWEEYCPAAGADHMWRKMPHTMLAKCAEALALRKAFPKQLAGLFAREELDQAGPDDKPPIFKRIPPPAITPETPDPPMAAASVVTGAPPADGLPPGFVYIEEVESALTSNTNVARYVLTLSTGEEVTTKNPWIGTLARQYRDQRTPCRVMIEKVKGGDLNKVTDLLTGDQTTTPAQGATSVPPPADDRIPF